MRAKEEVSVTAHSLRLGAGEFRMIYKPKIPKLYGGHSANVMLVLNSWLKVMLVLNSWLKDVEVCIKECRFTNPAAVQSINIILAIIQEVK